MANAALCKKLRILEGTRLVLLGAPAEFTSTLRPLPKGATATTRLTPKAGVVLAFFEKLRTAVSKAAALRRASEAGAVVWVCYPKLTSDRAGELSRDVLWKALASAGLRPVMQVALDDTWTAMRFKAA